MAIMTAELCASVLATIIMVANKLLVTLLFSFSILLFDGALSYSSDAVINKEAPPIFVAIFDTGKGNSHEDRVIKLFQQELKNCSRCIIKNFPLYDAEGNLREKIVLNALKDAQKIKPALYHFSWNIEHSEKTKGIEKELQKIVDGGAVIVAAVGENPQNRHRMLKLSETVMGQVKGVLLIGELNEKGNLASRSNYGEELFTALKSPKGYLGSSFSSVRFSARFLEEIQNKSSTKVLVKIHEAKKKSFLLYPSLNELFD